MLGHRRAGDNVGLLLRGVDKDSIKARETRCSQKATGASPRTRCSKAEVYVLKKEGGWSFYAVRQVSSAVLPAHARRDGRD